MAEKPKPICQTYGTRSNEKAMKKIIHHLRKQPDEVKRHVLHIIIFVAGVILVLLWVYSLGTNLANPDTRVEISEDLKPFSTLKDSIPDLW
ncbi:hypothetical protein A2740_02785 [Candidatus Nomurabacteria bacterium RIFCSPHIGHO2_01_FULL_43_16]|nr:MAG: hypothetical protein A2740_02785 [Candidatus Nomurabacteria bacterium RIFCSPHIGHO2_01_FULL_43_16]